MEEREEMRGSLRFKDQSKVTCGYCRKPKSWWTHAPRSRLARHIRLFHPERYQEFLAARRAAEAPEESA